MSDGRARAVTMLVVGACVIGLAPILVRLSAAGPAATGFWRLVFALPLLALSSRGEPGGLSGTSRFAVMAGAAFALDLACWHYGIANTSVSKASVLATWVSFGTIGPSLYNYGKIRGNTEAIQKYTFGKVYNPEAYSACSNMPRFGHNGILTEKQIKDVVALLLDPKSPVNQ